VTLIDNIKKNFTLKKNLLIFSLDLDPDPARLNPDPHIMHADPKTGPGKNRMSQESTRFVSVRLC
jgi:hypothetical protein